LRTGAAAECGRDRVSSEWQFRAARSPRRLKASGMKKAIEELRRRLGGLEVHTEPGLRLSYNFDATGRRGEALGVVFPEEQGQLASVVREAGRLELPLFMRGAGTGFSGGSVPVGGGLVVSTEKMRKVLSFTPEEGTVEVECGIVNNELQCFLEPRGFFFPSDPASLKVSTIGGNIAENAGGPRAFKYGVTRRHVRSLAWIAPSGEILETPMEGPAALLAGSEGTLGVIYSARLSALPLPEARKVSLIIAGSDESAMRTASALLAGGLHPGVMEFIDSKTMRCVGEYRSVRGLDTAESCLFLEFDGPLRDVEAQSRMLNDFCARERLFKISARDRVESDILWDLRRSISPSLARKGITKINEDVALPLGRLAEAVAFIHSAARELGLDCYIFGHCGDGNLHVNILTDRRRQEEMSRSELFVGRLFEKVAAMGGSLSGEHGIGMTKNRYLGLLFREGEIRMQQGVRSAFDPAGFLNPGKYFSGLCS